MQTTAPNMRSINKENNDLLDKLKFYILSRTTEVKNLKQRQSLINYIHVLFQRKPEMKWIEFEYCLALGFRLLGISNIPIKGETFESDNAMRNYVEKLPEELKNEMQQKVLKLPCVSPVILVEFQLSDEIRTRELLDIIEKLTSRHLPTKKCNEMIELLKQLNIYTGSELPMDVTFSQEIIINNDVTERDVYKIVKNNSIALFTLFESITKSMQSSQSPMSALQSDMLKKEKKTNFIRMDRTIISDGLTKITAEMMGEDSETCSEEPPETISELLHNPKQLKTSQHDYSPYDPKFPSLTDTTQTQKTVKSSIPSLKQIPSLPTSFSDINDMTTPTPLTPKETAIPALNMKQQPFPILKALSTREVKQVPSTQSDQPITINSLIKEETQLDLPKKRSLSQMNQSVSLPQLNKIIHSNSIEKSVEKSNENEMKQNQQVNQRIHGKMGKVDETNENEVIDCLGNNISDLAAKLFNGK